MPLFRQAPSYDMPEYREVAFLNGASHFLTKGNLKIDEVISLAASALKAKDKDPRIGNLIH